MTGRLFISSTVKSCSHSHSHITNNAIEIKIVNAQPKKTHTNTNNYH